MPVRVITTDGLISEDLYEIDTESRRDKKGNQMLIGPNNKKVRVHKNRILPINASLPAVYNTGKQFVARCPHCKKTTPVNIGDATTSCPKHGQFQISYHNVKPLPLPTIDIRLREPSRTSNKSKPRPKAIAIPKSQIDIDFKAMLVAGEIFTKEGLEFDYSEYAVRAHVFIVATRKPRRFSFNSYNYTWGKQSRAETIALFIANKPENGKIIGSYISGDVDAIRAKLIKRGYVKQEQNNG